MTAIGTRLYTFFSGKQVGADPFGNRYFEERFASKKRRRKRWVIFSGAAEPSKVPAEWHGWLHYTHDAPQPLHQAWEKPHLPNLTGTKGAYVPPGHLLKGGRRDASTSDYEAWKP